MPSILFVFTSAETTLTGAQAGWYLPEAAHPYYILAPHATIDFASPAGPNPPVSEHSVKLFESDPECIKFLADETVKSKLASAKKLSEINSKDYDAVFYPGGHGPVMDLPVDPINIKLASEFYQAGKITAAVCHGPAAITGVIDAQGKSIFAGKAATGFSNAEEIAIDMVKDVPFLLEDKIKSLGGKYEKATELWAPHVIVDGNLYTGQNPASASPIGQAILKGLKL
ncbi:ThiJ/PfpI [Mycena sanguinolenta]|uniref:D-lactate dehydratase n=1 Tax=Mycena sanguinolenta TaxID=230812 RepID=A0A8H6Y3Z7_9AGAR|nr:ThiJ/PfpI [Mycena sanguinolenta]